jgi:catechol 2,3-dioxygenase-like lactoylglutathione lyase family enzyme
MERAVPILPASDLRVAKDFYVGKLGFTVGFEATDDGTDGLLGVERGGISLTLDCPMSGTAGTPAYRCGSTTQTRTMRSGCGEVWRSGTRRRMNRGAGEPLTSSILLGTRSS